MSKCTAPIFVFLLYFLTCSPAPRIKHIDTVDRIPYDRLVAEISEVLRWDARYVKADSVTVTKTEYLNKVRQRLFEFHPDWSTEIKDKILNDQIMLGMNGLQVMAAMGLPEKQTKTVLVQMVLDYWTTWQGYNLTFKNGILAQVADQKSGAIIFSEDDR